MEFAKSVEFTQGSAFFFNQGKILLITDVNSTHLDPAFQELKETNIQSWWTTLLQPSLQLDC